MTVANPLKALVATLSVVACLFVLANSAHAIDDGGNKAIRQLSRGVANVLGGITEFPVTVRTVTHEEGEFAGLTYGVLKGLGRVLTREFVGVFEILTFPLGAEPIIEPEFPMEQDVVNAWHVRNPFRLKSRR